MFNFPYVKFIPVRDWRS